MKRTQQGFTLLEMVLVLVIMSSILLLITNYGTQRMTQFRRDRAALQIQQILTAGLSYYVSNGTWPVKCTDMPPATSLQFSPISATGKTTNLLQTKGYLPVKMPSPFSGNIYSTACNSVTGTFVVSLAGYTNADAITIAGQLPLASVGTGAEDKTVTAQVQIPGQNLNNARSINFANLYHNGACVPVPSCPPNMEPQIFAVPAGIAGVNDSPTGCTDSGCTSVSTYPITSFVAYATGPKEATATGGPDACDNTGSARCYLDATGTSWTPISSTPPQQYWRVCLNVMTEKGQITIPSTTNPTSANMYWTQSLGKIYVTTRCAPTAEPSGSSLNVWGPTS